MVKIESLLEKSINDIIEKYFMFFLTKKNVSGIGLGTKFIKNINTKEPVLHILVEKKVYKNKLLNQDIIPLAFMGIKTDVLEIGTLSDNFWRPSTNTGVIKPVTKNNEEIIATLNSRMRPIQPGCDIGPLQSTSGTLGCIVFDNADNTPYLLSSNHVLSNYGNIKNGEFIFQPHFSAYASFKDKIATLSNVIKLNPLTSDKDSTTFNIADAALGKILNGMDNVNKEIYNVGIIDSLSKASKNDTIYKVGKKTGYTQGKIISTNVTLVKSNTEKLKFRYKNQIICSKLSDTGDSGSLVFNKKNKAIGIVMSGSDKTTTVNPIEEILKIFNVHL